MKTLKTVPTALLLFGVCICADPALAKQGHDDPPGHVSGGVDVVPAADVAGGVDSTSVADVPVGVDSTPPAGDSGVEPGDDNGVDPTDDAGDDDGAQQSSGSGDDKGRHGSKGGGNAALADAVTGANGELSHSHRGKDGSHETLDLTLDVSIPNAQLGLASKDDASNAVMLATFTDTSGAVQAECELEFSKMDKGKAEFHLNLARSGDHLKEKQGFCNLPVSGSTETASGIPQSQPNDQLKVELEANDGARTAVLSGAL